jgi:MFS family permease
VFGAALGPALGGVLTDAFSWRAIFLAQAPIAAVALVAAVGVRGQSADLAALERTGAGRDGMRRVWRSRLRRPRSWGCCSSPSCS